MDKAIKILSIIGIVLFSLLVLIYTFQIFRDLISYLYGLADADREQVISLLTSFALNNSTRFIGLNWFIFGIVVSVLALISTKDTVINKSKYISFGVLNIIFGLPPVGILLIVKGCQKGA